MGTFHDDKHELHGITVVVDTTGEQIYIGRCDDIVGDRVVLLDADVHSEGEEGRSKEEYVQRAAQFGIWKRFDRIGVPTDQVASIRKLGDL